MLLALRTEILVVTVEHLALDIRLQALEDAFLILDITLQGRKGLLAAGHVGTLERLDLLNELAAKSILENCFLFEEGVRIQGGEGLPSSLDGYHSICALEQVLEPIKEHVEKFIHVHLHLGVHHVAVVVLEGHAKRQGVVGALLALLQVGEHCLELEDDGILHGSFIVGNAFRDRCFKQCLHNFKKKKKHQVNIHARNEIYLSEIWNHEKLLHNRVHIARCALVHESNVST